MEAIQGYNYYPAYQPQPPMYYPQQPVAYNPYQAQQKQQPTASAVTINIIEPKAYAGSEQPTFPQGYYNYPQASIYNQPGAYYPPPPPMVYPQPIPQPIPVNQAQINNEAPQMPPQMIPQMPPQMPQQVPPQVQVPPPPIQQPVQPQQQPQTPPVAQQPPQPQQPQEMPQLSVNDLPAINAALTQGDDNVKAAAIEAIARIGQGDPGTYTSLIAEVGKDTGKLNGDVKKVAEDNKKHAMWTLAILNKNQNPQVPLVELPGAKEIVDVLKGDPNPEMRKAAISALDFISKPEDVPIISRLLTISANKDKNPEVAALAKQALANLQGAKAA